MNGQICLNCHLFPYIWHGQTKSEKQLWASVWYLCLIFLILKYCIWSWTQIPNGISSITAMMRIWFNGQPKKDWTQNRYNLFLEVNTSLKRKENITYCGVRIRTTAPLWCEWTRWEEKEKEKRKYLARNALGSTKRPFKNFLFVESTNFCLYVWTRWMIFHNKLW